MLRGVKSFADVRKAASQEKGPFRVPFIEEMLACGPGLYSVLQEALVGVVETVNKQSKKSLRARFGKMEATYYK